MHWTTKLEQKLARFAVPGLIRIVAGFQFLVFVLLVFNPDLYGLINLDPERILRGEVWRLVSYIFLPRTSSVLWIIIQVMFLLFISDGLEQAWGSFRVNLYFLGSMIGLTIGCFLLWWILSRAAPGVPVGATGEFIYESLFLAFAVIYPNQEIRLMLILPIKIKYLAYVLGGFLLLTVFNSPLVGILILFALLPFGFFAVPLAIRELHQRARVSGRRQQLRRNSLPRDEAFHRCHRCGKTEADDPQLEFRVAEDEEEYCLPCLAAKKAESEAES